MTREERNLVIAAVDGSLPTDAEESVRELLKRDAEALEMYAREALLHGELEWHYGIRRQSHDSLNRRAEVVREYRLRQTKRLAVASLGIAAVVLLMLAAVALFRQVPPSAVQIRFNEGAVSRLVPVADKGDQYAPIPGDRLVLDQGAVEITLPQGVVAVIEAPAELEFAEGNALKMDHGTGFFRIERRQAHGFTLMLPESKIVDLGTSFGVIAPADGPAEIHLIDGGVRTQRQTGLFDVAADLKPGEAYREDDSSASGYAPTPFRNDRFPRRLPDRFEFSGIDFDRADGDGKFTSKGLHVAKVREVSVNNGQIVRVPGRTGNAVRFDRSGSHLEIRGWAEYHHRPSGTLSFWVRMPGASNVSRFCPVSWGSTEREDLGRWSVAIEPQKSDAGVSIRAGMDEAYHFTATSRLTYGSWHHLAFVFGPEAEGKTQVRIFIDGNEQVESMSVPILSGPAPDDALIIGTHHDPRLRKSHAFSGDIDDLRIYRSSLDAKEIAILADGGDPARER